MAGLFALIDGRKNKNAMPYPKPILKVEYDRDADQWQVVEIKYKFLKTNIDGELVFDVESEVVFKGAISDCESFIRLKESGHL